MVDDSTEDAGPGEIPNGPAPIEEMRARRTVLAFIVAFAIASAAYRLVYFSGQERTSALYIGVPAILAIGLTYAPRSRSATGMLLKGSTLALLLAGIVLPEGLVCLVFAAPLVALVAILVGAAIDLGRRHLGRSDNEMRLIVALPLLLLSAEGLLGSPFPVADHATATRHVAVPAAVVRDRLAAAPHFHQRLPAFLAFGFNQPVHGTGSGLAVGDERLIEFTGGNHDDHPLRLFGLTGHRGVDHHSHQRLRVVSSEEGRAVFEIVEDTTMTVRWVHLRTATVRWREQTDGTTIVTWRFDYDRRIHPAFYFAPMQRLAASEAARYLVFDLVGTGAS
jgi:hypothetical protein